MVSPGTTITFCSQRSTSGIFGLFSFELVYRHCSHSFLELVWGWGWETEGEAWMQASQYVSSLRERLQATKGVAKGSWEKAQNKKKKHYDKNTQGCEFQVGHRVLVLLSSSTSNFLICWHSLFKIVRGAGPVAGASCGKATRSIKTENHWIWRYFLVKLQGEWEGLCIRLSHQRER